MKTIILCGGTGYRLKEETEFKPKPMIEIGGKPILWHIMKIYEHFGFCDFIIALGYKGNLIKDYFVNQKYYDHDFVLKTATGKINHIPRKVLDRFNITFVDTGIESLTGERVRRLKKYIDSDNFMVTYGDGLADLDLRSLYKYHLSKKVLGTITAVHPTLKYGGFEIGKDGKATRFEKKAKIQHAINGGFMVFKKSVFNDIKADSMIEDLFDQLIENGNLSVYEHKSFFHAMDTYQDVQELNDIWRQNPPWKLWS